MVKTCPAYIHQGLFPDNVLETINECVHEVNKEYNRYTQLSDNSSILNAIMESENILEVNEYISEANDSVEGKAKANVFAKIGQGIKKIIDSIIEFIKGLFGKKKEVDVAMMTDSQKFEEMLREHPEIRSKALEGIERDWYTVKDIVAFENDLGGLIKMVNKNAIDHATFTEKVGMAMEKFKKSAAPIIQGAITIGGGIALFKKISGTVKDGAESLKGMTGQLELIRKTYANNYSDHKASAVSSMFNALAQAIGLAKTECADRQVKTGKIANKVKAVRNSFIGKFLKIDDTSMDAKRAKVRAKQTERENRVSQSEFAKAEKEKNKKVNKQDDYDYDNKSIEIKNLQERIKSVRNNITKDQKHIDNIRHKTDNASLAEIDKKEKNIAGLKETLEKLEDELEKVRRGE